MSNKVGRGGESSAKGLSEGDQPSLCLAICSVDCVKVLEIEKGGIIRKVIESDRQMAYFEINIKSIQVVVLDEGGKRVGRLYRIGATAHGSISSSKCRYHELDSRGVVRRLDRGPGRRIKSSPCLGLVPRSREEEE